MAFEVRLEALTSSVTTTMVKRKSFQQYGYGPRRWFNGLLRLRVGVGKWIDVKDRWYVTPQLNYTMYNQDPFSGNAVELRINLRGSNQHLTELERASVWGPFFISLKTPTKDCLLTRERTQRYSAVQLTHNGVGNTKPSPAPFSLDVVRLEDPPACLLEYYPLSSTVRRAFPSGLTSNPIAIEGWGSLATASIALRSNCSRRALGAPSTRRSPRYIRNGHAPFY